jgi:hypothetical protein
VVARSDKVKEHDSLGMAAKPRDPAVATRSQDILSTRRWMLSPLPMPMAPSHYDRAVSGTTTTSTVVSVVLASTSGRIRTLSSTFVASSPVLGQKHCVLV